MSRETWTAIDDYLTDTLIDNDPALNEALAAQRDAGLPEINVSPPQGKLLMLFAQMIGARRILEIGTLGGYSTIWMAKALDGNGKIITLEIDALHAAVAKSNLDNAGFGAIAEVRLGPAIDTLGGLIDTEGPFDLVFIDADKPSNPAYFEKALELTKPGSIIIVDNIVRQGALADADSTDPNIVAVRRLNELVAADDRVTATAIQTVGGKGYDGFLLARVI